MILKTEIRSLRKHTAFTLRRTVHCYFKGMITGHATGADTFWAMFTDLTVSAGGTNSNQRSLRCFVFFALCILTHSLPAI